MRTQARARPLIFYLAAAAAALAVPCIVMMAILANRYAASEQSRLEGAAHTALDHIISALDREVSGKVAMLQALATSPLVRAKNFAAFHGQCRELVGMQGIHIILRDQNGQQVINTRLPWGSALPNGSGSDADAVVAETGQAYVTDLYVGMATRLPYVAIALPVVHDDGTRSFLSASIPPSHFADLLQRDAPVAPYFASIADREGRIIARSEHSEEFVGKTLPGFGAATGVSGRLIVKNSQDVEIVGFYKRSNVSGWLATIGIEKAAFEAPLNQSLRMLALFGAALLLSGALFAWFIGRFVTTAFTGLGSIAAQLSGRGVVVAPPTRIAEAEVIGNALASASTQLHHQAEQLEHSRNELERKVGERTRELADKSALLEVTLENMDQGLFMVDQAGRVPVFNQRVLRILQLPKAFMETRPHIRDLIDFLMTSGEFDKTDELRRQSIADRAERTEPHSYERERPDGSVLEVRCIPIETGGSIRTFADITARHHATRQITHMAHHDSLTDLANRVRLRQRLDEAFARLRDDGRPFAVLFVDLDRFKGINDTMGHSAGDELIKMVAQRLKGLVAEADTIARLGGDEFAVVRLAQGDQREDAARLARTLLQAIEEPCMLADRRVTTSASIGIALAPDDGADAEQLLKAADLALYKVKSEGRNGFRFFDAAMDRVVRDHHELEIDLRSAFARDEFEVYYQPVVRTVERTICGVEALVRWHHPDRGMVSPVTFIPMAEETGLIVQLGEWVLRRACADAVGWPGHIKVAVNLSPVQVRNHDLVETVARALADSGLPAERLELEITETVLLEKSANALAMLHRLRLLGVSIVLDDFGTGYSSLSYLRAFPFDKIKIDKSFVDEMSTRVDCAAIICAVTSFARTLNMATTAEGVETLEQLERLLAAGCGQAQGFLFSRPRPISELDFSDTADRLAPARSA